MSRHTRTRYIWTSLDISASSLIWIYLNLTKQNGEHHDISHDNDSLKLTNMREWKKHNYFLSVSHFFIIKERNLIKIYYLCKKFRCLLIVYRRTIREFINLVKINWIDDYTREIVVLNVDGSSPSGHPPQTPVSQRLTGVFWFAFGERN